MTVLEGGGPPVAFFLCFCAILWPLAARTGELDECARLDDPQMRLACYERSTCTSLANEGERLRCFDRLAGRETVPVAEPKHDDEDSGRTIEPVSSEEETEQIVEATNEPDVGTSVAAEPTGCASEEPGCVPIEDASVSVSISEQALNETGENREVPGASQEPVAVVEPPADVTEILATITNVEFRFYGEYLIELDNGQIWQQIEKGRLRLAVGDRVKIKRGAFGMSHWLTAPDGSRSRFERLR